MLNVALFDFHIIIPSSLFVFKKYIFLFYQSLLLLYISLFIFNIRSFLLHIFHLYSIFYLLYFIIFITILSFFYFYYIFQHLYSMFGHCIYSRHITILSPFISILYRRIFIFNIVSISILYGERICILFIYKELVYLFTLLQAISLAELSRSSSSFDRLTSDRTNTKTDRM